MPNCIICTTCVIFHGALNQRYPTFKLSTHATLCRGPSVKNRSNAGCSGQCLSYAFCRDRLSSWFVPFQLMHRMKVNFRKCNLNGTIQLERFDRIIVISAFFFFMNFILFSVVYGVDFVYILYGNLVSKVVSRVTH